MSELGGFESAEAWTGANLDGRRVAGGRIQVEGKLLEVAVVVTVVVAFGSGVRQTGKVPDEGKIRLPLRVHIMTKLTMHQLLYNLYNVIALTEIKGYAMIQFSYMMLKLYNRGNFTLESDLARKSFESQATDKLMVVKVILPNMSRDFLRSDPIRHVEGKTFVRMTNLLQVCQLK